MMLSSSTATISLGWRRGEDVGQAGVGEVRTMGMSYSKVRQTMDNRAWGE